MKNCKILSLLLAVVMIFSLAACDVSSTSTSTSTITTSVTDADGNTTTNTTTAEVGVTAGTDGVSATANTTHETSSDPIPEETEAADEGSNGLVEHMYALYNIGAEGTNANGDKFFYAFNEDDNSVAAVIIITADGEYWGREGSVKVFDDHAELYSEAMDDTLAYAFSSLDENDCFTMTFLGDNDVAEMQLVDQDTIINDMIACIEMYK